MADRARKSPAPVLSNFFTRGSSARAPCSAARAAASFHSGAISSMAGSYSPASALPSSLPSGSVFESSRAAPFASATARSASAFRPSFEKSVPYANPSLLSRMTRSPTPLDAACCNSSTSPSRTRTDESRVRSAYASASSAPALLASFASCSQTSSRFMRRSLPPSGRRSLPRQLGVEVIVEVALENSLFDQDLALAGIPLVVHVDGAASAGHRAIVDHGDQLAGYFLAQLAGEERGALADEVGLEAVAH